MGVYKRGKVWWIDYLYQGKRVREPVSANKKIAQKALLARKGEIEQGRFELRKAKSSPVFTKFAEYYLEWAKVNKKSWRSDQTSLNHLLPFFGKLRLNQITPFSIEGYKQKRKSAVVHGRPIKPATINRELSCLRRMFNLAKKWGKAEDNPVNEVKFFKEETDTYRYLSINEINLLLEKASEHLKPILITALNTGMRLGEILGLRWDQVDFDLKLITVRHTKSSDYRKIPMNSTLTNILDELKMKACEGEYVFANSEGKPFGSIKTAFKNLRTKLKKEGVPHFRFHDLRHTFASHLVMSGADIVVVKELLGHKSLSMTMRYSHLSQEHARMAVENLSRHNLVTIEESRKTKNP